MSESLATRTWKVPAVTPCRFPGQLRPRLRDRDTWRVPVVGPPPGDESLRARPAARRAPLPALDDIVIVPFTPPHPQPAVDVDVDPGAHPSGATVATVDTGPGDDTRQHRFSDMADAMARQLAHWGPGAPEDDIDVVDDDEDDGPGAVPVPPERHDPLTHIDEHGDDPTEEDLVGEVVSGHDITEESTAETPYANREREEGNRAAFLGMARQQMRASGPGSPARPTAAHLEPVVPEPEFLNLSEDLLGSFARSVEEAGGTCHRIVGSIPETLLDLLVAELDTWEAVVSAAPDAIALAERFAIRGVEVATATPDAAAQASLGITAAVAAIAATGSLLLDSHRDRGRLAAVLPRVHVCLVPAERVVATPADVLRGLGAQPAGLPSSLALVTGPSRTGEVEQLLTVGTPGPCALHVILLEPEPDDEA